MPLEPQYLPPELKTGKERFSGESVSPAFDLLSFWRWAYSGLLDNAARGVLAEYLVARALGQDETTPRVAWMPWDLELRDGLRIEVKCAAYLQSWHQEKHSTILFDIGPAEGWDPKTNRVDKERKRRADAYVFALLKHKNKATVNPMDMDQWEFYVVSTAALNEKLPTQKRISLKGVQQLASQAVPYHSLARAVEVIGRGKAMKGL